MGVAQILLDNLDLSELVIGWYKLFGTSSLVSVPPGGGKELMGVSIILITWITDKEMDKVLNWCFGMFLSGNFSKNKLPFIAWPQSRYLKGAQSHLCLFIDQNIPSQVYSYLRLFRFRELLNYKILLSQNFLHSNITIISKKDDNIHKQRSTLKF